MEKVIVPGVVSANGLVQHAWVARPVDADGKYLSTPKGAIIVVQEIFGVNEHIRWVMQEQYAKAGYLVIAPCFFDSLEANTELAYTPDDTARGRALVDQLGMDAPLRLIRQVQAGLAKDASGAALPCGVVGFCWGGSVVYLSATRLGLPAVSYYGGRTVPYLHEHPQAPVMFHFGERDPLITAQAVAATREAHIGAPVHVYPAGHGFNRATHADYHEESSQLALKRSLEFFERHLVKFSGSGNDRRSYRQLVDEASARIRTLSIDDAKSLHGQDNVVFVDIRDPRELTREGTIPGALKAPRGMLEFWVDPASPYYRNEFDPSKQFVFFCAAAWRSALATAAIKDMGHLPNIAHVEGGFAAWKAAGLPIETLEKK